VERRAQSTRAFVVPRHAIAAAMVLALTTSPVRASRDASDKTPTPAATAETADPLFDDVEIDLPAYPDPFEGMNRSTHGFNLQVDRLVIEPMTDAYTTAVPDPARRTFRRVFSNLNSPAVIVNDLLQGELDAFAVAVARFTVNTTIGVAGLFDPATSMGLEEHHADFGQTLAVAGVGSGPFLMLPVFGPTTVRDGVGTIVDFFFRPTTYLTLGTDQLIYATLQAGGDSISLREQHNEGLKALRASSVDYYAALRSAYFQNRTAALRERLGEPMTAREPEATATASRP
jgi:phospholipid-binding lipoprotein MlaA